MTTRPSLLLERRHPAWTWQAARILLAGSRDQAFLDHAWIGRLLDTLPASARYPVALRILGLSPHYFINQWTSMYPARTRRSVVLEAEAQRNRASRREIVDRLLLPYLHEGMSVLDFGCGPGFLAKQVSPHVGSVIAVDVSRGTIACARHLNPAHNVLYRNNLSSDLQILGENSVDLVISFAVFQHLRRDQSLRFLREFKRVLRPNGRAICQFAVSSSSDERPEDGTTPGDSFLDRYRLSFRVYSPDELLALLSEAGFPDAEIHPISKLADIADDVGSQHLVVLEPQPLGLAEGGRARG
jgi:cyclopropane fatty-acyl-phospholipid synthase-like methyltransferase